MSINELNDSVAPAEGERFGRFLEELRSFGRREKTLEAYARDWGQFSQWYAGVNGKRFDLPELSTLDVQDYLRSLQAEGRAPATINRRLAFLKRYVRFGVEQGAVRQDLQSRFQRIPGPRRQALAPQALALSDLRKFLKELEIRGNVRDQAIVYLFLHTGLRVSELAGLDRSDLELSPRKGSLRVRAEVAKGGRERTVPVPLAARRWIDAYLNSRQDSSPSLFIGQRGPLKEDAVVRILRKYAEKVGLAVTPHLLRHTFAYQYLKQNENDLVGLAAILGHESLDTTRRYTQKRLEDLQEGAERVGYFE